MKEVILTPDQERAADAGKRQLDACVVAGPGSGKTTVLVEYFARLVEAGVDPLRILAITFTEKAAGNMRKKLAERFQDSLGMRAKMERAWVSTVHGFCSRLLKENAVFAGIDPEFTVADANESKRLQLESMSAAMDGLLQEHPAGMRALIRGLRSADFDRAVLDAYDAMRGAGVRVEQLSGFAAPAGTTVRDVAETLGALRNEPVTDWKDSQKEELRRAIEGAERIVAADGPRAALEAMGAFSCNLTKCKRGNPAYNLLKRMKEQIAEARYAPITELYVTERRMLLEILARFDRLYRERKRQAGLLDFADLEEYAVRLLEEHTDARARVRGQFDHILMDEFQDTNGQQARLMQLARAPDRFYAVGDINQSIFGFRHAEPEGFRRYQQDIAARGRHLVELNDNFRSRAEVLSAVETIVEGANGIVKRPLVARRVFEKPRDVCVELLNATELEVEARWVARRIAELAAEGFEFRDVAVLVRNTEVIAAFTQAFEEAGVPYVVNMGKGFYETAEVKDLTQLLRTVANPRDEVSLAAVLRSPLVAVSDETLLALKAMGDNLGGSLMRLGAESAAGFDAEDYEKLCGFRDRLREWRVRREYVTFDRLLAEAMDRSGYAAESGARGAANIDKFLAQARQAAGKMALDEFVEELALLRDSNPRERDAPPEDSSDAVNVMTVHASKGLEFPVVFLAALHKGVNTSTPVVAFSRQYGLGARWRDPATGDEKDDLFQHALRAEWKQREDEESNRLLYVATTRAEEHLVLSFSRKPAKWAKDVAGRLGLDLDLAKARDEVQTIPAPDGKQWKLRVVVTDRAPEGTLIVGNGAGIATRAPTAAREPEFLPAAPLVERQASNATVTALAKFASCPRAYYLGNYLGFEGRLRRLEEPGGELPAGELGSQVHALLAGSEVTSPDGRAVRLAQVFRESALGNRVARAARVEREFDFLMAVEGLVMSGQVDLWFEEGGELVVVDYKTDAVTAAEAHQRAQEYELQVRLYALAVERVAGRAPDKAWLHFLRPNTVVEVDLTPSLLESPEQMVKEFQEAQERGEFPLREGERCKRCPFYRDLCPAGHG
jgi:ATP-dependent exoDNAse (exonuclease V) beta subunit